VGADEAQQLKSRWGGRVHGEAGLGWDDLLAAAAEGTVPAILLLNSGRPAGWGFSEREKALLRKARFVAAVDAFDHEVRDVAHVILPAPLFPELEATTMTVDGLVQLSRRNMVPKVVPLTQAAHRLIGMLGGKSKAVQPVDLFRELAREVPAFGGLQYGSLGRSGARGEARSLAGVGA
jgi:predicted molibdopterin-dependent oxidoreductase YjgC